MKHPRILEVCKQEFSSLRGRFGRDDERILKAMVEMCEIGFSEPGEEIPEMTDEVDSLVNRWRGDSRGGGLELSMVNVWRAGQKLAANS